MNSLKINLLLINFLIPREQVLKSTKESRKVKSHRSKSIKLERATDQWLIELRCFSSASLTSLSSILCINIHCNGS